MVFIKTVLVCLCVISLVSSSAIPMWEMLSREEKMAYLYSHFLNQVEEFCEYADMNNCNKELLKHGLGKLHSMPDDHLDRMDPYQRGAHNIIWDSMMDGHAVMKMKPKPLSSTTTKPTAARPSNFLTNLPNYQTKKISNIQDQIQAYENTRRSDTDANNNFYLTNDLYTETNYLNPAASSQFEEIASVSNEFPEGAGVGPMIVRVKPDGTLVDKRVPIDEDLIHFKLAKIKVPPKHMVDKFVETLRPTKPAYMSSQPYSIYMPSKP